MQRRIPPLNALRAFEAAARYSSFTKAAEELRVTHAAVGRHVRELESWLGHPLFERLGRGVALTSVGIEFSRSLTRIFDLLHDATLEVAPSKLGQQLTLTVDIGLASRWLITRLRGFIDQNPDLTVHIIPLERAIPEHFAPDHVCLMFDSKPPEQVESEPLCKVVTSPVCSRTLAENNDPQSHDLLLQHPLLHEDSRKWWQEWLIQAGVEGLNAKDGPMFYGHLALDAAEADLGIALGDNLLAADAIKAGKLVRLSDVYIDFGYYYLIRPALLKRPREVDLFVEWLQLELAPFAVQTP